MASLSRLMLHTVAMSGSNTAATQAVQALLQRHLGERPQGMWNPGRRGGTRVDATRRWLIASVASFATWSLTTAARASTPVTRPRSAALATACSTSVWSAVSDASTTT